MDKQAISGRATGVLFFAAFGALWACIGLSALHQLNLGSGLILAVIVAGLVAGALLLLKKAEALPGAKPDPAEEKRFYRVFARVNITQWIAIVGAIVVLNVIRHVEWIVPVISIIVGLHLFPLARLFQYRAHYVTGTLLILWSVVTMVSFSPEEIAGFGALGTSVILFSSATNTLLLASRGVRSSRRHAVVD